MFGPDPRESAIDFDAEVGSLACSRYVSAKLGHSKTNKVHSPRRSMYAIYIYKYAYMEVVWGVNVGIYMAYMECLGHVHSPKP